jgi:hypothetical protein
MTSEVKQVVQKISYISALFLFFADTRVSAEAGPVTPTVDPAEIRGLSTT